MYCWANLQYSFTRLSFLCPSECCIIFSLSCEVYKENTTEIFYFCWYLKKKKTLYMYWKYGTRDCWEENIMLQYNFAIYSSSGCVFFRILTYFGLGDNFIETLEFVYGLEQMVPVAVDCWEENIKLQYNFADHSTSNSDGVETRYEQRVLSIFT